MIRTAIAAIADGDGSEVRETLSKVREILSRGGFSEVDFTVVPFEQALIRAQLRRWSDGEGVDLILTVGGIGAELRHRVPEATEEVLDRQFPGLAESMRSAGARVDRTAPLWRGLAGVRRGTLIVNLPSGPLATAAALTSVAAVLAHASRTVTKDPL